MLETMATSTTFVKCGLNNNNDSSNNNNSRADPLRWDCQQFPADSNTSSFSCPIKQEVMDTYETTQSQTDFTELKAMSYDYATLSGGVDPVLSNNNNDTNRSNNNGKLSDQHLNIYIKPLSPPTPSSARESFCFNASPSDVTSSGSISPQGMQKIDYPTSQDAFDDIANIVGISCGMGADSTVPTLENDLDLEDWIEKTAQNIKPLGHDPSGGEGAGLRHTFETILPTSSDSVNSITNISMSQPYLTPLPGSALANLLTQAAQAHHNKGPRVTSLEQRDPFPANLSPILRSQLTGYHGTLAYPQIKLEPGYDIPMKQEYGNYDQMPHSTVGNMGADRLSRLGLDNLRNKQKPPKPRPRVLGGGGNGMVGSGCQSDQGKKMMHHCQVCNRGFLNKSNIKVHLRTHTGEKPFGCEHCSKAFRQKAHLLKHMSIHKRISRD